MKDEEKRCIDCAANCLVRRPGPVDHWKNCQTPENFVPAKPIEEIVLSSPNAPDK